jgi:GTP-binding protein
LGSRVFLSKEIDSPQKLYEEQKMFVDKVRIHIKAGRGGNGCISFRREKHVPKGGPDGGDGGRGGNVVAQVRDHLNTLAQQYYTQHYKAGDGTHGQGRHRHGRDGSDAIVHLPPGTIIRDADSNELLADLKSPGETVVLTRGGLGGRGNARFKSSTNQVPRVAEKGEPGEEKAVELELRLIADVGLVGYPNAGKSSILARISAAKPKIASYPFTTLSPILGVVRVDEEKSFVLADIPGLIEGAHSGVGLGDEFLRHISRTRVLIHVIDAASVDGRDPVEDFEKINEELALYDARLAELPQVIAANKMDLPQAGSGLERLRECLEADTEIIPTSAATGEGLTPMLYSAFRLLEDAVSSGDEGMGEPQEETFKYREEERGAIITKDGSKYILTGRAVRRAVLMTDLKNEQAVMMLHRRLKQMGVIRGLVEAGARDGDTVVVEDTEFTFMS